MLLAGTCHSAIMSAGKEMNWSHTETLELLAVWGDLEIQEELAHNKQKNIEIFCRISEGLAAKGFTRMAEQCRSKTKDLRRRFKKAMAANKTLGASFHLCPYFQELRRILHGRVSATERRLSHSIAGTSQQSLPASLPEEGETSTLEGDIDIPLTQEAEDDAENEGNMEDLPPLEGTSTSTQTVACGTPAARNPTDFPSAVDMSELSLKSRPAYFRVRTRRVSAVQKVGEKMMEQAAQCHQEQQETARREHEDFVRLMTASLEEERQTRDVLGGILQGALTALTDLTRGIRGEGGTQSGGNSIPS